MRGPLTPGLYWLALDTGEGEFLTYTPLLVRVSLLAPYDEGRIEFLHYPGNDPTKDFNPLIDVPGPNGLAHMRDPHAVFVFKRYGVKLVWIAAVKPPRIPRVTRFENLSLRKQGAK